MHIDILDKPFDPWQSVKQYQEAHLKAGCYGALSLFIGTMRDFNSEDDVKAMKIEHYQGMTEKCLADTVSSLISNRGVEDIWVIHRIGMVYPGDPIVAVGVWSAHREDAYAANRIIVEKLKSEIPFWKKEMLADKDRWVSAQKPGGAN